MSITATHNDVDFAVGDVVRVSQKISEGEKSRIQIFEGVVIGIKGRGIGQSFTVRRIGSAQVGIEKIFPVSTPTIDKVTVVKKGGKGVRHAKLYFVRNKSKKEISKIYSRSTRKSDEPSKTEVNSAKISSVKDGETKTGKVRRKPSPTNTSK